MKSEVLRANCVVTTGQKGMEPVQTPKTVKSNVYTLRLCRRSVAHDNQHQIMIWTGKLSESMKSEVLRANCVVTTGQKGWKQFKLPKW